VLFAQACPAGQSSLLPQVWADAPPAMTRLEAMPLKRTPALSRKARRRDMGAAQIRDNSSKRLPSPTVVLLVPAPAPRETLLTPRLRHGAQALRAPLGTAFGFVVAVSAART
jgi:hypothetical protein